MAQTPLAAVSTKARSTITISCGTLVHLVPKEISAKETFHSCPVQTVTVRRLPSPKISSSALNLRSNLENCLPAVLQNQVLLDSVPPGVQGKRILYNH